MTQHNCPLGLRESIRIQGSIRENIMKEVVFYYDVVCPFAYMASRLIEGVASQNGAKILWKPVLLGMCQLSPSHATNILKF